ncbi:hypothetical protein [Hymenobacter lucidus]|uniref:DUF4131 domain-containing protein n=1 Tax=Hymenobacter lucidus TaxID=2880930 RepID=A0ABS8AWJ2_9BACT|nr:hypothetical protein [Hymenobacter lucidus]MCB2410165.1 hypothetical protein [Hymenobacter lucidus]
MPAFSRRLYRPWFFTLLLGLALVLLELETGAWLCPPVLVVAGLGLPISLLLTFLGSGRLQRLARSVAIALGLAILAFPVVSHWQQQVSQRRAAGLIRALGAFHTAQHAYPDSLEQLVPAYLPQLPRTGYSLLSRTPFAYIPPRLTQNVTVYGLGYGQGFFVEASYSSKTGRWHYDD